MKFKLETKTPWQFFTPVNCIILIKFQLPTLTGRKCSRTPPLYHIELTVRTARKYAARLLFLILGPDYQFTNRPMQKQLLCPCQQRYLLHGSSLHNKPQVKWCTRSRSRKASFLQHCSYSRLLRNFSGDSFSVCLNNLENKLFLVLVICEEAVIFFKELDTTLGCVTYDTQRPD